MALLPLLQCGAGSSGGGGGGTVTSVAMTGDGIIFNATVTGSPITTSGTLLPVLLAQTKNTVLSGPTTGANATPTFRALVAADLPFVGPSTIAAVAHMWLNSYTASTGAFTATQPAFTDISGTIALAQTALTTAGDLLYANATPALARLAIGSTGNVLTVSSGLPVWAPPATSGTVTSFSAGNLSPLFTTTVATSTTTPALSFSLSNAAGGTVFGNATGSSGAPSYTATPVLGINASVAGTLGLATSVASGTTITLQNLGALTAYNWNYPLTVGASGSVLTSAAGGSSPMTWTTQAALAVAWSSLTNASGALTLANGANATTFNQTSAAAWTWANTTAATSGGSASSSPAITLTGATWTGAASATVTWTIQFAQVATTTTDGAGYLTFTQTAGTSTSQATGVAIPMIGAVHAAAGGPYVSGGLAFSGTLASGASSFATIGATSSSAFALVPSMSASTNQPCELDFYTNAGSTTAKLVWNISAASNSGANASLWIAAQGGVSGQTLSINCALGTSVVVPGINFGGNGGNNSLNFSAVGGTQTAVAIGGLSGQGAVLFNPSTGTANFIAFLVSPTVNDTATTLTATVTSASVSSATGAILTVTPSTAFATGATIVVSGLVNANNTQLNGTWVVASSTGTTVGITGSGWTTHISSGGESGTATTTVGSYTALKIAVTETSVPGASNKLIDCFAGSAGTTEEFAVTNKGLISVYGAIATVSNGVPSELQTVDLTAQAAAISAHALYTPATSGMFRISWSADITTADSISSVLGGTTGFQVTYTSPTDSVSKTTVAGNSVTTAANTTGTSVGGCLVVYAKTGVAMTFSYGYTAGTPNMVYEIHVKVEAL